MNVVIVTDKVCSKHSGSHCGAVAPSNAVPRTLSHARRMPIRKIVWRINNKSLILHFK